MYAVHDSGCLDSALKPSLTESLAVGQTGGTIRSGSTHRRRQTDPFPPTCPSYTVPPVSPMNPPPIPLSPQDGPPSPVAPFFSLTSPKRPYPPDPARQPINDSPVLSRRPLFLSKVRPPHMLPLLIRSDRRVCLSASHPLVLTRCIHL